MSEKKEACPDHPNSRMYEVDCSRCHGEGVLDDMDDWESRGERCYACGGTGEAPWLECEECAWEAVERLAEPDESVNEERK